MSLHYFAMFATLLLWCLELTNMLSLTPAIIKWCAENGDTNTAAILTDFIEVVRYSAGNGTYQPRFEKRREHRREFNSPATLVLLFSQTTHSNIHILLFFVSRNHITTNHHVIHWQMFGSLIHIRLAVICQPWQHTACNNDKNETCSVLTLWASNKLF